MGDDRLGLGAGAGIDEYRLFNPIIACCDLIQYQSASSTGPSRVIDADAGFFDLSSMSKSIGPFPFFCCNLAKFLTVNPCDFSKSLLLCGLRLDICFCRRLRRLDVLLPPPPFELLLAIGLLFSADIPDIAPKLELLKCANKLRFDAISLKLNPNGL